MKIPLIARIQLFVVGAMLNFQNLILEICKKALFHRLKKIPQNILIFKVGGIGDTICAIPAFIAIRKFYPNAKITLLTSSGKIGSIGAKELLEGVWYIDELKVYYSEDIALHQFRKNLIKELKEKNIDLFIQIPDDWANFKILFRNLFFAKFIGAKSAFGFQVRTILSLFKNTQINYTIEKQETEFLLDLLRKNNIKVGKVECRNFPSKNLIRWRNVGVKRFKNSQIDVKSFTFEFNIRKEQEDKINNLLKEKWGSSDLDGLIIGICPGGKTIDKRWPAEKFGEVAKYFQDKYNAKFIIFGGGEEDKKALKIIQENIKENNVLSVVNKIELIENIPLLKKCNFLITNDTGIMHLAAAIGKPVVALFNVRNILGKWFPFGEQHKILYKRFLNCDYRKIECIKKSIEMILVEEVIGKSEELMK